MKIYHAPRTAVKLRSIWFAPLLAAVFASSVLAQAPTPYILGPAGTYTVQSGGSTKVEYGDGWVKISWVADPAPNPGPSPNPNPNPNPVPPAPTPPPAPVATGKLYVTYVYDGATETQAQATARADLATASEWAGLDVTFRAYEATQKAINDLNLKSSLGALPCAIVQELKPGATTAPVVKVLPSVDAKAVVVAAVKDLRGSAK
jgi:hypothetical protein